MSSIVFSCFWSVGGSSITILPLLVHIIRTLNTLQCHDTVDFVQDSETEDPHSNPIERSQGRISVHGERTHKVESVNSERAGSLGGFGRPAARRLLGGFLCGASSPRGTGGQSLQGCRQARCKTCKMKCCIGGTLMVWTCGVLKVLKMLRSFVQWKTE